MVGTKAISLARLYSINGIVSNLPDQRVKIAAEGNETNLEQFIVALDIRNAQINVTNIEKDYSTLHCLMGLKIFYRNLNKPNNSKKGRG